MDVGSAFSLSVSAVDSDDGDVTIAEMTDITDGYTFGERFNDCLSTGISESNLFTTCHFMAHSHGLVDSFEKVTMDINGFVY